MAETTAPTMSIDEKIFRCWQRGDSISETRNSVKIVCGTDPGFEPVRLAFVDLSHRFAGSAA